MLKPSIFRTCAIWIEWNGVFLSIKNKLALISNANTIFQTKIIEAASSTGASTYQNSQSYNYAGKRFPAILPTLVNLRI